MADLITREQFERLEDEAMFGVESYHRLLEEFTGIVAKPYTAYLYYDSAGNYIGDSDNSTLEELLKHAYVEVSDG